MPLSVAESSLHAHTCYIRSHTHTIPLNTHSLTQVSPCIHTRFPRYTHLHPLPSHTHTLSLSLKQPPHTSATDSTNMHHIRHKRFPPGVHAYFIRASALSGSCCCLRRRSVTSRERWWKRVHWHIWHTLRHRCRINPGHVCSGDTQAMHASAYTIKR